MNKDNENLMQSFLIYNSALKRVVAVSPSDHRALRATLRNASGFPGDITITIDAEDFANEVLTRSEAEDYEGAYQDAKLAAPDLANRGVLHKMLRWSRERLVDYNRHPRVYNSACERAYSEYLLSRNCK